MFLRFTFLIKAGILIYWLENKYIYFFPKGITGEVLKIVSKNKDWKDWASICQINKSLFFLNPLLKSIIFGWSPEYFLDDLKN